MSSEVDHRFLDDVVRRRQPYEYASAMLQHRRVLWAVELLDNAATRRADYLPEL
jgi:hypothetical protein